MSHLSIISRASRALGDHNGKLLGLVRETYNQRVSGVSLKFMCPDIDGDRCFTSITHYLIPKEAR